MWLIILCNATVFSAAADIMHQLQLADDCTFLTLYYTWVHYTHAKNLTSNFEFNCGQVLEKIKICLASPFLGCEHAITWMSE